MFYFATWGPTDKRQTREFPSVESLFEWLQDYHNETDEYPTAVCIFKGDCIFDGG